MAVGMAGMVILGSYALQTILSGGSTGFWMQMQDYAFMFTMIAGLVLVLYALVSLQSERAKDLQVDNYGLRKSYSASTGVEAQ